MPVYTSPSLIKKTALLLGLVFFLSLSSCAEKGEPTAETDQPAGAAPTEAESAVTEPAAVGESDSEVVRVYSSRAEHLIKPLFERFTSETGVAVEYVTDKEAALIARLKSEGERTPADVFLTVDAGNLWFASSEGLLQPVESELLNQQIPAHLRAGDNHWFGLSIRARTIVYSSERVDPAELSTYENLADPKWAGRLCLRTSQKVYNQSLVAGMIASRGEEATEETLRGWVANLAVDPLSNDTKAMEAIVAGVCDLTVVNSYYFGRLLDKEPEAPLAIFWPNQDDRGVHVNISGIGVTRHAKQPELAIRLIEWLASTEAQQEFAGNNREYPVNPSVPLTEQLESWGDFRADELEVEQLGSLQQDAIRLMDRVEYR